MFHLLLAVIYMAFISLGLPDSLLGSAWPIMYQEFGVSVSYAGVIYMLISAGTIVSSLQSDRLTRRFGTGRVTAFSVLLTAVGLWGFSISGEYWHLIFWTIPYGLGAGSVDASLNNYVALHYESRHMSWLHCMWGVGASVGPYIMGYALTNHQGWSAGYRYIAYIQLVLTGIIMLSLPLWKSRRENGCGTDSDKVKEEASTDRALSLKEIIRIPGVKQVMLMFFCYCALEQTTGLWASSYLVLEHGIDSETAASFASMFFIGITAGRAVSGFVTMKLNDNQMIRLGQAIIMVGLIMMCLPFGHTLSLAGLIIVGLGCAPIYPCIIHSTPVNFGVNKSQAIIGVLMASAYIGNLLMAPLFGVIADYISVKLFPVYLLMLLVLMVTMHIQLKKKIQRSRELFD